METGKEGGQEKGKKKGGEKGKKERRGREERVTRGGESFCPTASSTIPEAREAAFSRVRAREKRAKGRGQPHSYFCAHSNY